MHLVSEQCRVIGTSAVVATGIPVAVGHAMALKMKKSDAIVVCFFGDGATEEGCFLESVNFAALKKLPILFVCENNFYAIHEPIEKRWATNQLCERIATYGIETRQFKKTDILPIHEFAGDAINKIRRGEGPVFMECQAYRWREHVGPCEDFDQGYRRQDDAVEWVNNDQFDCLGQMLTTPQCEQIDHQVNTQISDAFEFAESSSYPMPEELHDYNYAK